MKAKFVGIITAKSQAYNDLIIREGASEQLAGSWANYLESNNLLGEYGYHDYTLLTFEGESTFKQIERQRMVRNGCL